MGTRYNQGDFVFSGNELGEVLKVENPKSDSPTYHVNIIERKEQPPEHMKASEIRKANLEGYHLDTLEDMFEREIQDMSDMELARSESHDLRIPASKRNERVRVATSGDYVAVNGNVALENGGSIERGLREEGYDPDNLKRDPKKGGRIPNRETEIQVFYIVEEVQKETGIDMETLNMIFDQKYDPYSDVMYWNSSGNSVEFIKQDEQN